MASSQSYQGDMYSSADVASGMGVLVADLNTRLTTMKQNSIYMEELGGDSEVLIVNAEEMALLVYRSFVLQKLLSMFVFRTTSISGSPKLRLVSRNLCVSMTLEQGLRAVGQPTSGLTDNYDSASIIANNQILASIHLQVFLGS